MEEFPKENTEQGGENTLSPELQGLADMAGKMGETQEKSYEEAKRDGELPEGVRDERDYKEYLEEKRAREKEAIETKKSFEKRLEINEVFYDQIAIARVRYLIFNDGEGDIWNGEYNQNRRRMNSREKLGGLMECLYLGTNNNNVDDLDYVTWTTADGDTASAIVEKKYTKNNELFEDALGFAYLNNAFNKKASDRHRNDPEIKERMDTSAYEKNLSDYVNTPNDMIDSGDVDNIKALMRDLNFKTALLFDFELDKKGYYHVQDLQKDSIVPTLRSRIELENLFLQAMRKNAEIGNPEDKEKFNEIIKYSTQGKTVADRLGMEALN
ncbi:hypothetical protein IKD57_01245 [Candidatus Saccharibacteria bacterium]|nr:hypothetical protein [Candidatus Saccharibacteria bacterium]